MVQYIRTVLQPVQITVSHSLFYHLLDIWVQYSIYPLLVLVLQLLLLTINLHSIVWWVSHQTLIIPLAPALLGSLHLNKQCHNTLWMGGKRRKIWVNHIATREKTCKLKWEVPIIKYLIRYLSSQLGIRTFQRPICTLYSIRSWWHLEWFAQCRVLLLCEDHHSICISHEKCKDIYRLSA